MSSSSHNTAILCILDGFGHNPQSAHNAIALAHTPTFDRWQTEYKNSLIGTDGIHVGLPEGQMGNSEVGHMNIGAGRVALPEFGRIDAMLGDGSMLDNIVLQALITAAQNHNSECHLMGLLSEGGVHSHQDQMVGFAKMIADAGISVKIHAFCDGRDTPPQSAIGYFDKFIADCAGYDIEIVTVSGRFYAMDRDNRWERVQLAYDAMMSGQGNKAATIHEAINNAYADKIHDEFIVPTIIGDYQGIKDNDVLLMSNFRADRVKQILSAFLQPDFSDFERSKIITFSQTAGSIKYSNALEPLIPAMVKPLPYPNGLGEYISKIGLKQLRLAETEKFAHVTFFLNGGSEAIFEGEDRILIPSPKVRTYDEKPEMAAFELTSSLIDAIKAQKYDFIIVNFANADMVGHTGIEPAAIKAIEVLDSCMAQIEGTLKDNGGFMCVTADHGNAEMMLDLATSVPHTQHTTCPVPFYLVDPCAYFKNIEISSGRLADLAPTMLTLKGIKQPDAMTGTSIVKLVGTL
ncbi:MAG: 2,3-bisphosphoglycerate-independent phosphoglycerate mutase [Alphaproteobacteria bacterium]|jgi:2,3-bisphosphoglycerate-independent phosphoglycerate mutase